MDRIARLRADLGAGSLDALVVSHPPNITYLTGLRATAGATILFPDRIVLVVDPRYVTSARQIAERLADTSVVKAEKSLDEAIADVIGGTAAREVGIEAAHLSLARFNRIQTALLSSRNGSPAITLVPTERLIERRRAVKDADEIATLREAAGRLAAIAHELPDLATAGRTERQIAAAIDERLRAAGFEGPAFETIVASGPNSALPHARPTPRELASGDGVVLDFGGIYDGYCVDLTRTLHVGPESAAFRHLFDAVTEAHRAALDVVKPGTLAIDIDGAARRALAVRGLADAFAHGTGHGLGLEVHEEPRISSLAPADEAVVAGMVFTIEPGAYLPGVGGVRIEDDVLVTESGCEVLTHIDGI